LTAGSTS